MFSIIQGAIGVLDMIESGVFFFSFSACNIVDVLEYA
jgi:hypothetical protein